jgi:hypothetical protein
MYEPFLMTDYDKGWGFIIPTKPPGALKAARIRAKDEVSYRVVLS